jgi:hypothetical protein
MQGRSKGWVRWTVGYDPPWDLRKQCILAMRYCSRHCSDLIWPMLTWHCRSDIVCWIDPNGRQTAWDRVSGPFDLAPWSGVPTNWCLWAPIALRVYKRWKGAGGTYDEVRCDLSPSPTSPSDWSLRRSGGGNPPHHFGSPVLTGSGVVSSSPSQRPADLLPLHQQVPLCRLQRCRVHQTSPLVRHADPKTLSDVPLLTFKPTRCRPSRSLSTNNSVFLILSSGTEQQLERICCLQQSGKVLPQGGGDKYTTHLAGRF